MDQTNQQANIPSPSSITDWESINREWKESGLTQQAFCQERNIRLSTFVYHRGKIIEKHSVSKSRQFTEVKLSNESSPPLCRDLTLHLPNNIRLSIPPNFSSYQIKTILSALGMQTC